MSVNSHTKIVLLVMALSLITAINSLVTLNFDEGPQSHLAARTTPCQKNHNPQELLTTKNTIDDSVKIGIQFIRNHQKPNGLYNYGYDWSKKKIYPSATPTFQAQILLHMILLYKGSKEKELLQSVQKALPLWSGITALRPDRQDKAPLLEPGATNESAVLLALSLMEYIEAYPDIDPHQRSFLIDKLDDLLNLVADNDRFAVIKHKDGNRKKSRQIRLKSMILLAFAKAAKNNYKLSTLALNEKSLADEVTDHLNTLFTDDTLPSYILTYYPWGTQLLSEIASTGWGKPGKWYNHLIHLTDVLIETGSIHPEMIYASSILPGIILSCRVARQNGDNDHMEQYNCHIERLVKNILSRQIGKPNLRISDSHHQSYDANAIGGIMNDKRFSILRTDLTCQQMLAMLSVQHFYYE